MGPRISVRGFIGRRSLGPWMDNAFRVNARKHKYPCIQLRICLRGWQDFPLEFCVRQQYASNSKWTVLSPLKSMFCLCLFSRSFLYLFPYVSGYISLCLFLPFSFPLIVFSFSSSFSFLFSFFYYLF